MSSNLTLIESDKLDAILEKAFIYDILAEENQLIYQEDWAEINKKVEKRKRDFFSCYVEFPLDLDETIVDKLEEKGYN